MEFDDKKVKEIFLGLALIIVLIILIFVFTQSTTASKLTTKTSSSVPTTQNNIPPQTVIINSYNTNSFNEIAYKDSFSKNYKKDYSNHEYDKSFRSWSSREIQRGVFGNEIHKYVVHVENTGNKGKYFRVKFNLEDCYRKKTAGSITKYIYPNKEGKFVYTDIKSQYCDWDYEIN